MNQTENYQLCLWELSDRILMDDFNADNQKVDAALTELSGRSILRPIKTVTLTESAGSIRVDLSDVDWSQWELLVLDADLVGDVSGTAFIGFSDNSNLTMGTAVCDAAGTAEVNRQGPSRLILFCNHSALAPVNTLTLDFDDMQFRSIPYKFNYFSYLDYVSSSSKAVTFAPGCKIQVWGVR